MRQDKSLTAYSLVGGGNGCLGDVWYGVIGIEAFDAQIAFLKKEEKAGRLEFLDEAVKRQFIIIGENRIMGRFRLMILSRWFS